MNFSELYCLDEVINRVVRHLREMRGNVMHYGFDAGEFCLAMYGDTRNGDYKG